MLTEAHKQELVELATELHRYANQLVSFARNDPENADLQQAIVKRGDTVIERIQAIQALLVIGKNNL